MFPPFAAKAHRHAAGQLRKVPRKANRYFGLNTASLVTFKRRKKTEHPHATPLPDQPPAHCEAAPPPQPEPAGRGSKFLVRKTRPALCAAARKHFASIPVRHSLPEAMLLFSMELLGLIGSQHKKSLLSGYSLAILDYNPRWGLMSTQNFQVFRENSPVPGSKPAGARDRKLSPSIYRCNNHSTPNSATAAFSCRHCASRRSYSSFPWDVMR